MLVFQTVEEGNAEEFDDMMEQLLEHDGGAQDQIIADVIQENRNHDADETHDSQVSNEKTTVFSEFLLPKHSFLET